MKYFSPFGSTHYHLVVVGSAAVRSRQRSRTLFAVPWEFAGLTGRTDGDSVNASHVSVASAVVVFRASVAGSPNVDVPFAASALQR